MLIDIHQADRIERLERALLAIEGLTYLHPDLEDKLNGQIYTIAHGALGFCHGCAKHGTDDKMLSSIEEAEKALKELNIMDVERVLAERHREKFDDSGLFTSLERHS
jgi:hypothetical protein